MTDDTTTLRRPAQRLPEYMHAVRELRERLVVDDALRQAPPSGDDTDASWDALGEGSPMLPAPGAEERQILARLARSRGVTVRGAPGPARTATIASLLSHLVARGKRVLVTSQHEQPLEALHDMLPEGIRALCVSALDRFSTSPAELDQAARAISERVAGLDHPAVHREARAASVKLDDLGREISDLRARLGAAAERERKVYRLGATRHTPTKLGRYLAATAPQLGYIDDALPPTGACPLNKRELVALYSLAAKLDPGDCAAGRLCLPAPEALPTGAELAARMEELAEIAGRLAGLEGAVDLRAFEAIGPASTAKLTAVISLAAGQLPALEAPWLRAIRDETSANTPGAAAWRDRLRAWREGVDDITAGKKSLAAHRVYLPDSGPPAPDMVELLTLLRDRLTAGKGPSKVFARDLHRLRRACSVDGAPPDTREDVDRCLTEARVRSRRHELVRSWNDAVAGVGGPTISVDDADPELALDRFASAVADALEWEQAWSPLHQALGVAGVPAAYRPTAPQLAGVVETMRAAAVLFRQRDVEAQLTRLGDELSSGSAHPGASPLWDVLADAFAEHDWAAWDLHREEARRLLELQPRVQRFDHLAGRLAAAAPGWAGRVVTSRGDQSVAGPAGTAHEAWAWRQADIWLSGIGTGEDTADLQAQLAERLAGAVRLTADLASASAWLAVAERHTDAPPAMDSPREAVPVWVMPADRVVESFDPAVTAFDVVIVDDSAGCGLASLAALGIARKAIIVGDDEQTGRPAATLWDVAKSAFPDVVTLDEHSSKPG